MQIVENIIVIKSQLRQLKVQLMLTNGLKGVLRTSLTHTIRYQLLDHKKMEEIKHRLFSDRQLTFMLKAKFLWKQTKYTIAQGSKDLWNDAKWIIALNKRKHKHEFTGFQLAESQRIKIDLLKFIPYSIILTVPLAELSLPIILWLYPYAVPSHYMFDTAMDQRIEKFELVQYESHKILIDKLTTVMTEKLKIQTFQFSREEFFKDGFFQVIDQLDKHLNFKNFSSDELLKVLQFLGGGDFFTGTQTFNRIVNLFTMNIPRVTYKILRWSYGKLTRTQLGPYKDPFFVRGYLDIFKFNYFPFEILKCKFLIYQINRKFRLIEAQDRAFEKYGMDDIVGSHIKQLARQRGLATLSCYQTLKNVIKNDWVKYTTHPKFQNNNIKLWYSVMMYNFLKESSREIN